MASRVGAESDAAVLRFLVPPKRGSGEGRGNSASARADAREAVRKGLPYSAFETLVAALGLAASELSRVLYIPERTLARRRTSKQLPPDESDRVVRAARVLLQAQSVFANDKTAAEWLKRPNRALGNEVPLTLLDTDMGAREVEEVINRIRYGIYS